MADSNNTGVEDHSVHHELIRQSIELARSAASKGNHPFGALLVDKATGKVILTAENTVVTERDRTRHAELNLMSAACKELDNATISRSILYTSTEPCCMCTGAIWWTGVRTVIFGCSSRLLADIYDDAREANGEKIQRSSEVEGIHVPCGDLFNRKSHQVDVIGPLLEDEARTVHDAYWPKFVHEI
ncbi:Nucleoside deaminase [Balamuthia mandrillaris]